MIMMIPYLIPIMGNTFAVINNKLLDAPSMAPALGGVKHFLRVQIDRQQSYANALCYLYMPQILNTTAGAVHLLTACPL